MKRVSYKINFEKLLQLTRYFHRTFRVDVAAIGTNAIFFWCCRFNLKKNLFVRWILEAHV